MKDKPKVTDQQKQANAAFIDKHFKPLDDGSYNGLNRPDYAKDANALKTPKQ
jgi:hypothetical protein